ncbi:MAG: hypothetical protein HY902_00395 [Deltaproteobacteria bacterium]|nr:hypothetical protein [Deltaproteobacteria bacterium]
MQVLIHTVKGMFRRHALAAGLCCLLAASGATPALAEPFGVGGVLFSGERMIGIGQTTSVITATNGSTTYRESNLHVGTWGASDSWALLPRLGLDFAVSGRWTAGAGFGFARSSGTAEKLNGATTSSHDTGVVTGILFAPRVGYLMGFGERVSIWWRGGVSYYSLDVTSAGGKAELAESQLAVTVDPQLLLSANRVFALAIGVVADVPLFGTTDLVSTSNSVKTTTSTDTTNRFVGVTLGLVGRF